MKAAHIFLSGMVQGVLFRSFVKMYADKMKMKGYVRNLKDGRLEVWIEGGPDEVLFEMIRLLKKGPEGADVIKADIKWEKKKRYDNFSIAR